MKGFFKFRLCDNPLTYTHN